MYDSRSRTTLADSHPRTDTRPKLKPVGLIRRIPAWFRLFIASCAATLALMWPFPARLHAVTLNIGDALHQAWTVHWIQYALTTPGTSLFAAPSNAPSTMVLAINQPIYTSAVLGLPLYWLGWSPMAVFNALVLLSFVLACWAMALLGRELTGSSLAGLTAGIAYAFATVRVAHISHLNLLSSFWTVLLLLVLFRLWRRPPTTRGGLITLIIALAVLAAAQILADVYNALYMVCALLLFAVYQLATRRWGLTWRLTGALIAGAVGALVLCLPILLPTFSAWRELQVARDFRDHEQYAARVTTYLSSVRVSPLGYHLQDWFSGARVSSGGEDARWPGLITLALAVAGLIAARRSQRLEQGYFICLLLVAGFLSFGPTIRWAKKDAGIASLPYRWLYDHAPLFASARAPSRWGLLVQLALAVLAAYGSAALWRYVQTSRDWRRVAGGVVSLALVALLVVDVVPPPVMGRSKVVGEPLPDVYRVLNTLPPDALLEWPLENANEFLNHRYEYYGTFHRHPLVNSASSIVPQRYIELRDALRRFPDPAQVILLRDLGVRYVNVNLWEVSGGTGLKERLDAAPGLRPIGEYEDGRHVLYEVLPQQPELPAPTAEVLMSPAGAQLVTHVHAPLWLDTPSEYYRSNRQATLRLMRANGGEERLTLFLPPVLLPGSYAWLLPDDARDVTSVWLDNKQLALAPSPESLVEQHVAGPQFVGHRPPTSVAPGTTLACQAYGKGPLTQPGLILSINLIDEHFNVFAKRDDFFHNDTPPDKWQPDSFTKLPCDLALPPNLPPGRYFLALGLFDPVAGIPVPIAGADGVQVPSLWRIPAAIQVAPVSR